MDIMTVTSDSLIILETPTVNCASIVTLVLILEAFPHFLS